jgi:hypothetical protein
MVLEIPVHDMAPLAPLATDLKQDPFACPLRFSYRILYIQAGVSARIVLGSGNVPLGRTLPATRQRQDNKHAADDLHIASPLFLAC